MPANASGGDVTGLCGDCSGDVKDGTDTEMEAEDSADGDVDVDINDQDWTAINLSFFLIIRALLLNNRINS